MELSALALDVIIDLLPGHVYWKDTQGRILGCNQRQAEALGFASPAELIGKTDFDLYSQELAQRICDVDRQVMESKQEISVEEWVTLGNGNTIPVLTKKRPLINAQGEVVGILGISFDITDRKALEGELKKAKEKAEVADKEKTDLLHNFLHDLNTPLNHIVSSAQLLPMLTNENEKKELLDIIIKAGF